MILARPRHSSGYRPRSLLILPAPMRSRALAASAILGGCLLCVGPGAARAQGGTAAGAPSAADRETARKLLDDGDAAFEKKDYDGALKAYAAAHAIMHVPTTGIEVAKAQV